MCLECRGKDLRGAAESSFPKTVQVNGRFRDPQGAEADPWEDTPARQREKKKARR